MTNPLATRSEKYLYEFDAFRVDPVRRRLLRDGEPVPLTPKAFSILLILLENRGEVVEKEELIRRVWPDTCVTEANLTQNVSSLRKALGERANDHRYVVTVPGQGYSFVADVAEVPREPTGEFPFVDLAPAPAPAETPVPLPAPGEAPSVDESEAGRVPPRVPPAPAAVPILLLLGGRRRFLFAGLILGFLIAVGLAWLLLVYLQGRNGAPGTSLRQESGAVRPAGFRPTMAVLGFRNLSGDVSQSWLATALSEMLITELSTGYKVRLVSGEEIARVKEAISLPATAGLSEGDLQQVHDLLGADMVVVGSYLSLPDKGTSRIRIDLQVLKAPEGEVLASLAEIGTEENLFDLVSLIGRRVRRSLGWAEPTPEEARAVQALQPANPEANRLYAEGLTRLRGFDSRGARDLLEQAAQADPRSAVIRSALSLAWTGLGYDERARQEAAKAVQLSAALPKAERLAIEARFAEAKQDWARTSEIYRSLWTFYPDNLEYGLRLANSLSIAGRNAEALATVASLRGLPPPLRDDPRIDLAAAQIARRLGNAAEELQAGTIAADKGNRLGQTQVLGEALLLQGDALYVMGRPEESIARFHRARGLFAKAGNNAALARTLNRIGAVLLDTGDYSGAEKHYREALATAHRLGSKELIAAQTMALAFAAGYLGDLERSRSLAERAYAEFVELGEHLYETRSLYKIGEVLWKMGDAEGARRRYEEVLSLARRSGNRVEEVRALDGIARILASAGSLREARSRQEQALRIARASGDPLLSASYQASLGQTLILQGDLPAARRHLEAALEAKRRVRDRLGISQVLGLLSSLEYEQGDLEMARRYAAEQRALADQIQAALAYAAALQQEGRLDVAAGNLATARKRLSEALRLSHSRGAALLAAGLRLDLARLALLERRPGEAVRLASEAADWYARRGMTVYHSRALALLAQALLADGRPSQAQEAAEKAHSISEDSEDLELQIEVVTAIAPSGVATGQSPAALGHLRWAIGEADRIGYVTHALEARLTLGALQLQTGDAISGRAVLEEVRRSAAARGFKGVAQRAVAALAGQRVPPG
ncbi:MAG TPA: tetratricopeptide repeat protein [Thermoanaerobaculia bacterium]|jgi:DNA-binding winged helix-turn-helix (wHTH) protein/tetratricopeptide (TPR) repeat protein